MNDESGLGLYLHVPFCRHRCAYCDFNTYTTVDNLIADYVAALRKEVRQVGRQGGHRAATIYFGGGTPSLLAPEALRDILGDIMHTFPVDGAAEVTIEANPETLSLAYLKALTEVGINRLSLGAQSADPSQLALLERGHDFDRVIQAVTDAAAAGIRNINLDLIYGLPGQSLASWERSLTAALALEVQHLSLYCLTIEPGTPMNRWLATGQIEPPDPDLAADQYELASQLLAEHGFIHYEISNWAREGYECQHNVIYWRNHSYLGFGAGAHGHASGYRYSVVKQPRVYIRRMTDGQPGQYPWSAAVAHRLRLSQRDKMSDEIITKLRLLEEGMNLDDFERQFEVGVFSAFPGVCEQMIDWGLLQVKDRRLLLTVRGRFLSNQVFYRFM